MWRAILKGQLYSIPEQATYCSLYAVNKFIYAVAVSFMIIFFARMDYPTAQPSIFAHTKMRFCIFRCY